MDSSSKANEISLFASRRERWLWTLTSLLIVTIFSTLGLASTLVGVLLERREFDSVFIAGFFLMGVAVLTQGLQVRRRGFEIGVALGVAAVYLMVFARLGIPERSHLFEYGVVAMFIHQALTERAACGRNVPQPFLLAIAATATIGTLDELVQLVLPSRHFEWIDIAFNVFAAVMGSMASAVLGWARRRATAFTQ